ncbi:MAG: methionyl-tRNA formyltransferase [Parvibaculales bacterium]
MGRRIVFMGTPDFAVPSLIALKQAGYEIAAVYTRPPQRQGRGMKQSVSPVHAQAEHYGIEVQTPDTLKSDAVQAQFAAYQAELAVVVAYGLILPQAILDIPPLGCLNIHASLLPRWRGAAPIQRAIMAGDQQTGIAIMQMAAGLDTGPVLLQKTTPIGPDETAASLHDRLSGLGAQAIVETLDTLEDLTPQAQSAAGVTYAEKIDKAEARIDWQQSATALDAHIRGLSPFPGAWCEIDGARVKILAARAIDGSAAPGTVLDNAPSIACGEGALQLLRVQRAGKAAMDGAAFMRGAALAPGQVLA